LAALQTGPVRVVRVAMHFHGDLGKAFGVEAEARELAQNC